MKSLCIGICRTLSSSIGVEYRIFAGLVFVDFIIGDYIKLMYMATYKTSKVISGELKKAFPDNDNLIKAA